METLTTKYGLRLMRDGQTIGEIPMETETAARAAYWQMVTDTKYLELGVTFWVVYDTQFTYEMTV